MAGYETNYSGWLLMAQYYKLLMRARTRKINAHEGVVVTNCGEWLLMAQYSKLLVRARARQINALLWRDMVQRTVPNSPRLRAPLKT